MVPNPYVISSNSIVNSVSSIILDAGTTTDHCLIGIQPVKNEIPNNFTLSQNYPNPFNPTTNINFSIPKKSYVKIIIYDATGKVVDELVNFELNAGIYKVDWNGDKFASGVYYYQLTTDTYKETKKMVLIK